MSLLIAGAAFTSTIHCLRVFVRYVIIWRTSQRVLLIASQAMFLREPPPETPSALPTVVPSPSPASGLYIRNRGGDLTKVSIPQDCLAFQTGEALEIATGGKLRATPHWYLLAIFFFFVELKLPDSVRVGGNGKDIFTTSRETFALFMQPDTDQLLSSSTTFGQFSRGVFTDHYSPTDVANSST